MLDAMPDDLGYEQLARVLATPEMWSERELGFVEFCGAGAREPFGNAWQLLQVRRDLERSIDAYESALSRYEASRR
jgi:hypothetical protein